MTSLKKRVSGFRFEQWGIDQCFGGFGFVSGPFWASPDVTGFRFEQSLAEEIAQGIEPGKWAAPCIATDHGT